MDILQHYVAVGNPDIDQPMDYGLGLHDALARNVQGWVQGSIAQVRDGLREIHRHVLGELLRRLVLVQRMIENIERDIRVYASAVLHAADYASRLVVRQRRSDAAAHVGTPSAPPVAELQPPSDASSIPPAGSRLSPDAPTAPLTDDGTSTEPPAPPPPAPPPPAPPPPPPAGSARWYFVGYCDRSTGIVVGYCQASIGGPPYVSPPNEVLAGPFDSQADCLAWHASNSTCERTQPPPPPPPPSGERCYWPVSRDPINYGSGTCCRVYGGGDQIIAICGPGTQKCQPWVLCNTEENAIAITWTEPAGPTDPGPPPGKGWVAVPIWLPSVAYWEWWTEFLHNCGVVYDAAMRIPPNACAYWPGGPPAPPPPPPPPEPPPPGTPSDPWTPEECPAPHLFGLSL